MQPSTPCLQSQIGQDRYLRRRRTAQVEAALVLSVIIPWGPVRTAVNGTVVARPARTTLVRPGSVGTSSTAGRGTTPAAPASLARATGAAEDQRFPMSHGPGADQRYVLMTLKACAFCHALPSSRQ